MARFSRIGKSSQELVKKFEAWPRWVRMPLGVLLIIGGVLGFLPILGFWMIPLGLAILAIDIPAAHRLLHALKKIYHRLRLWLRRKHGQGEGHVSHSDPLPEEKKKSY
jgi:hypothetical protein